MASLRRLGRVNHPILCNPVNIFNKESMTSQRKSGLYSKIRTENLFNLRKIINFAAVLRTHEVHLNENFRFYQHNV